MPIDNFESPPNWSVLRYFSEDASGLLYKGQPIGSGGSGSDGHTHANKSILDQIRVDSFGQLYFESGYNPDHIKEGSVLALLGSLNDESGYSNIVSPVSGQQTPVQVIGLDGNPALSIATNQNELSIPNLPTLISNDGATLYAVYSTFSQGGFEAFVNTANNNHWWRYFDGINGNGYFGIFRNSRCESYPLSMPLNGNFLVTIHSRTNDYEVTINNQSKGIVGGSYWKGDRFQLFPQGRYHDGYLLLLLVIPFWVDRNSFFHQRKLQAIKGRFPSLPFSV